MFRFKELIENHMDELAHMPSSEQGKVIADAKSDIQRGLRPIGSFTHLLHVDDVQVDALSRCAKSSRTVRRRGFTAIRPSASVAQRRASSRLRKVSLI